MPPRYAAILHNHSADWRTQLLCLLALCAAAVAKFMHAAVATCTAAWGIAASAGSISFLLNAALCIRGMTLWRLLEHEMRAFLLEPLAALFLFCGWYALACSAWALECTSPGWGIALVCHAPFLTTGTALLLPLNWLPAPLLPEITSNALPCPAGLVRGFVTSRWQSDWVLWALSLALQAAPGAITTMLLLVRMQPAISWAPLLGQMSLGGAASIVIGHFFSEYIWAFVRACLSQATRNYLDRQRGRGILAGARALSTASRAAAAIPLLLGRMGSGPRAGPSPVALQAPGPPMLQSSTPP